MRENVDKLYGSASLKTSMTVVCHLTGPSELIKGTATLIYDFLHLHYYFIHIYMLIQS